MSIHPVLPSYSSSMLGYHVLFQNRPDILRAIAPHAKIKTYAKEDFIVHHGDTAGQLWIVLKGWVQLTRQTPDGKESVVGLCAEGDLFGEAALFPHANYPYNAQILAAGTELAALPADVLRKIIVGNAEFSNAIMALFNERTAKVQLKLEHMSTMSAAQRLGCFLLRLCHTQVNGAKTLQIPVEKHILAGYLGMKPETLSRSQQQLKPLGIAVTGHDIAIDNIEMLRQFVCNSCSESGNCDIEDAAH